MNIKEIISNKVVAIIVAVILGVVVFVASYTTSYIYNSNKVQKANAGVSKESNNDNIMLSDGIEIILTKRTLGNTVVVERKLSVKELRESEGLAEISEEKVLGLFKDKGYEFISSDSTEILFEKPAQTLEANKYYIGEKDGYIAIFKTNEKGVATIESEEDITTNKIDNLPSERDKNSIRNFKLNFDDRDECEEMLSNFIS